MAFEEKLKRFIKLYEDMEKKMAQDDLFNKEFTVIQSIVLYITMLLTPLIHAQMLKARSLQWKNDGVYPADAGSVPINRKKNRFKDILPCKQIEVILTFDMASDMANIKSLNTF